MPVEPSDRQSQGARGTAEAGTRSFELGGRAVQVPAGADDLLAHAVDHLPTRTIDAQGAGVEIEFQPPLVDTIPDHTEEVRSGRLVEDTSEPYGNGLGRNVDPHLERHVIAPSPIDGQSQVTDRVVARSVLRLRLRLVQQYHWWLRFPYEPTSARARDELSARRPMTSRAEGHTGCESTRRGRSL